MYRENPIQYDDSRLMIVGQGRTKYLRLSPRIYRSLISSIEYVPDRWWQIYIPYELHENDEVSIASAMTLKIKKPLIIYVPIQDQKIIEDFIAFLIGTIVRRQDGETSLLQSIKRWLYAYELFPKKR